MSSLRDALNIPSTQVPISLATSISYIVPLLVCYLAIAVLAVTHQTRVFRIALWPLVAWLALRAGHIDMSLGKPELKFFNGDLVCFMICVVAHSLSWTLATTPLVRRLRPANSSPSIIMDALDLMTNLRGIGWNWSRGLHIPRETRPTNRLGFAFYTLLSFVANLFLCSVFQQVIQSFSRGTQSSTQALTIFDNTLPFPVQHLRAGIIAVTIALTVNTGTQAIYDLSTLVGVLVVRQDPAQWPPMFAQPWRATSLSALWGRRWHQTLRHTLRVCAAPFGAWAVPAAFVASGLVHQVILLTYDTRAEAWQMVVGFGMMAPGVLAERAYRRVTGRRVGGVLGWVWMMAWMLGWGSLIVDGFLRAGMFSQLNAIDSESPLLALVESSVVTFDAWLHAFN